MQKFTTKRLCLSAAIAALYAVLTYAFMPLAFGPVQIRPAEALCLLPLLYAEAIPALAVGCLLSNLSSPYLFYDVIFGTLVTVISAFTTYTVGRFCKTDRGKIALGGLCPVLLNALILPLFILFVYEQTTGGLTAYLLQVLSLLFTQSVWVYGLGAPLYMAIKKLQKK